MYIFDAHNDTLGLVVNSRQPVDLGTITGSHVCVSKMEKAGVKAQIFAAFVPEHFRHGLALHQASLMVDAFWQSVEKYSSRLKPLLWQEDFSAAKTDQRIGCILALEGGEPLEGKLENLRNFFRLGVRVITLTWNNRNDLADGVGEGEKAWGLSEFGRQVVTAMNALGMVVDVSHLAAKGFWEVLQLSKDPVIASHSNAYAVHKHGRNLTDEQIKALTDGGGVIGVNFCPSFLLAHKDRASIDHVIHHLIHLIKVGGSDGVGLGSDFDGISTVPEGLEDIGKIDRIALRLKHHGFPDSTVEKIMGLNFLRVFQQIAPKKGS